MSAEPGDQRPVWSSEPLSHGQEEEEEEEEEATATAGDRLLRGTSITTAAAVDLLCQVMITCFEEPFVQGSIRVMYQSPTQLQ